MTLGDHKLIYGSMEEAIAELRDGDKPARVLTFNKSLHLYFLAGQIVPNVTRVLERSGLLNYAFLGDRREFYLARGARVHLATSADDQGNLDEGSVSPEIRGYLEAWRAFRRDYDFVPQSIERMIFHPQHHYAGRLDRTGVIRGGDKVLLDIKTGHAPGAVRYQLAAYAACLRHPRAWLRRAVELHTDGGYRVIGYLTSDFQRDFDMFLAALEEFKRGEV